MMPLERYDKIPPLHYTNKGKSARSYKNPRKNRLKHKNTPIQLYTNHSPFDTTYSVIRSRVLQKRNLNLYTSQENERIKKKIKEYDASFRVKREGSKSEEIEYKRLALQFDSLKAKINSLLLKDDMVISIKPFEYYKAVIKQRECKQYKVYSRTQPTPMKIHAEIVNGTGQILLSQEILRPTTTNCDKAIQLIRKRATGIYMSIREEERSFINENIYITIEAYSALTLYFQCAFGIGNIA